MLTGGGGTLEVVIGRLRSRILKRKPQPTPYPIHGLSVALYPHEEAHRQPFTWFTCPNGHLQLGTPWRKPISCSMCHFAGESPHPRISPLNQELAEAETFARIGPIAAECFEQRGDRITERG